MTTEYKYIQLSFLQPAYEVISESITYEPVQLSLWDDNDKELAELLELRRDRFEERRERRAEAYQRLQQKHSQLSNSSYQAAKRIGDMIPFGQPILVGHHSERRHRRDAERIDNNMRKSIEHQNTAEYYAERLAAMESNDSISSDDPDAISKLEARLQELESFQELMKSANKIIRKKNLTDAQKVEQMRSLGIPEKAGYKLLEPDFCQRIGFADYRLQNNNANIRRIKERISELKQSLIEAVEQGNTQQQYPDLKLTVINNREINRLQIVFDTKPPQEVRKILKDHGFRWSGGEGAWQRYLNNSSEFAKNLVIKALQNLPD
ncbi:DUF3560 domain-containing protein [Anabaena azotica]|uniref:DUF3560 domain-containing protein n=1 Tax=Anabaena azotica FACHB-119 TaxID=947527 RepID=A0ABR8D9L5_9NOST|nr:DUF3560 domain-containing protein [Anabaena azotica]MBD2503890.1 DUF3560 domain-containing protein [Anabaena azotica FACHB-119]